MAAGGGGRAFLPAPLPPAWAFPADLWPLLSDAKQQIGVLEGIGRRLPNPELLLRPLQPRKLEEGGLLHAAPIWQAFEEHLSGRVSRHVELLVMLMFQACREAAVSNGMSAPEHGAERLTAARALRRTQNSRWARRKGLPSGRKPLLSHQTVRLHTVRAPHNSAEPPAGRRGPFTMDLVGRIDLGSSLDTKS